MTALVLAALIGLSGGSALSRPVPACPEDAVLLGVGDFEAGRWTGYVCGPAVDDYLTRPAFNQPAVPAKAGSR